MTTQPELSHELFKLDATIISSLLQKSIRRGELIVAQCAALTLLMRALSPFSGPPEVRVFRPFHGGGLAAPSWFSMVIGAFCPIAPCGRSSL